MNVVTPIHAARLSAHEYKTERDAIRERYGESSTEAVARRDQALAKLFHRSGWTQAELAKAEGKTQQWVSYHTLFGRFLSFTTTVVNTENSTAKLTERRFRRYWDQIDKSELNERCRFQHVLRLIGESSLRGPQHEAIRAPLVQHFADGKWHKADTIAKKLDTDADHVNTIVQGLKRPSIQNPRVTIETRRHGPGLEHRIFKRERTVGTDELATKLTPIVERLQRLSKQTPGTIPNGSVAELAAELRNLLDHWRE